MQQALRVAGRVGGVELGEGGQERGVETGGSAAVMRAAAVIAR
jgi:hypothetical protein